MYPDSKKIAGIILAKMRPSENEDDEDSNGEGLKSAAQDLIDAVGAKDVDGVVAALKAAYSMCSMEE